MLGFVNTLTIAIKSMLKGIVVKKSVKRENARKDTGKNANLVEGVNITTTKKLMSIFAYR